MFYKRLKKTFYFRIMPIAYINKFFIESKSRFKEITVAQK